MNDRNMRKTVEMPVVESIAETYRQDPLGIYSHRRVMDCRDIDSTAAINQWNARKPAGDFTDEFETLEK